MRVLMVSDVYFPRVNGVSTSMETFRRVLMAQGIEVQLVVPRYGDEPDEPGIHRVAGRPIPGDREDRLVSWSAMQAAVQAAARTCDVVHIQTPFAAHYAGLKAARQWGKPVLATYHTLFEAYFEHYLPYLPKSWLQGAARRFSRQQCNALDVLVVPSSAMQQRLSDYGVSTPMHVLPTGIPLGQFRGGDGAAFRQRLGIAPNRPLALFVGRVAHEKNIGFLIEAVQHARLACPDALLLIAGEGPALHALQAQVARLGLQASVRFVGYLDRRTDLPACYAAANAFVFASRTETQGLVLLEAMAAGLPVLAQAEMGTVDILAPGRGAWVLPNDPVAFGAQLGAFLNDPGLWPGMAQEAKAYAASWSDAAMGVRLAGLYEQLCGRLGAAPAGLAAAST